ncbi:MFS transporter [Candidatus Chloroploca sp. M-50]|uniref:MFS transporter n=1 Tax=Candidatus Chloroploca mongolica TaxID=2528176 RepID=A0ABS4D6W3_9CHLR|nr:MFS transporter [Candidatus Chloroploca mongolica]MBP1465184.1 MFS transporter [Candidatus Chloroploca mongolica]
MQKSPLLAIFLVVFIDLLGFGIILPLLPFYAEHLGASEVQVGLLLVTYAAAQFVGAPIIGSLSDRFGRRRILVLSQLGTVLGFVLLGLATSLPMLFLARFVGGIMASNITVAQAYISDVTDDSNRARGLALIGAAFGLGFILGPVFGGILATFSFALPAFAAAAVAFVSLLVTLIVLPEPPQRRRSGQGGPIATFKAIFRLSQRPVLKPLYLTGFLSALALIFFQSCFALYGERRYSFGPRETGLLLAYVGVVTVILQAGFTGRLVKRFGEERLIITGTILLYASLMITAIAWIWPLLLISLMLVALGSGLIGPSLQSLLIRTSEADERGQILGVYTSLDSLARMLAPIPATWMLGAVAPGAPLLLGGVLAALAGVVAYGIYNRRPILPHAI